MIERAKIILAEARGRGPHLAARRLIDDLPLFAAARPATAMGLDEAAQTRVIAAIAAFIPTSMSPREAIEALYALKAKAATTS